MSDGLTIAEQYLTITGKTVFKTYHTNFNIGERRNTYKGAEECSDNLNLVQKQYLKLKITC